MSFEENSGERNTEMYFFDTYALAEVFKGNPTYKRFENLGFNITVLNLFEFHQFLLKAKGEAVADKIIELYSPHIVHFDMEIIKKASKFRYNEKRKNLSMSDCIGYIYAKEHNMVFLTGDKEFADMRNVEFVK